MKQKLLNALSWVLLLMLAACRPETQPDGSEMPVWQTHAYHLQVPPNFPPPNLSTQYALTTEMVELGKRLYSDPILSSNGKTCSGCHAKQYSFSSPLFIASNGDHISIPPHVNLAFNPDYNWNGSTTSLDGLGKGDFAPEFFNTNADTLFRRLSTHPLYPKLFYKAFGTTNLYQYSYDELKTKIAASIAQYMRTLISANSHYDRYKQGLEPLTQMEMNGMVMFFSETGDCFHCHSYPLFTDNAYHNNGIDNKFTGQDAGRFLVTGNDRDLGAFSTPTLRNIELTAPYMHDGRYATLEEVIEFYNSGVKHSSSLDPIMTKPGKERGLQLNAYQKQCLVAFLKALTDTSFVNQ